MKRMSLAEFKRITAKEAVTNAPIMLTSNGEDVGVFCSSTDVVVVSDLHPRVRHMIKSVEKRARMGMPKPEVLVRPEPVE